MQDASRITPLALNEAGINHEIVKARDVHEINLRIYKAKDVVETASLYLVAHG
jgi:hypothetical protein